MGDIDRDRYPDVVTANNGSTLYVRRGQAGGTLGTASTLSTPSNPSDVAPRHSSSWI